MNKISVNICAYILALYPNNLRAAEGSRRAATPGQRLDSLAHGLALPSFWSREEILSAFVEANRIWGREADIEFNPINVSRRSHTVPAEGNRMWPVFLRHLRPKGRGIGVGFVFDLPGDEGGWGGSRIVVLSGEKARAGLAGNAGNLLAHELGHVLIDDPQHLLAGDERSNLMYRSRNPMQANAGILNDEQKRLARERAATV